MGWGAGGGEESRASVCLCPYIFEVRANFRCDRPLLDQDLKWGGGGGEGGRGRAAPSSIFIHFIRDWFRFPFIFKLHANTVYFAVEYHRFCSIL